MIGIHIYNKDLEDYSDSHKNITKEIGDYKFTVSYHDNNSKEVFFENDLYAIFIDGWIFNTETYKSQAKYILNLYMEKDNNTFPYLLEGQFNICIVDKQNNSFKFITDIFSLRKHYYAGKNKLYLSSDLQFIVSNFKNCRLNKKHIIKHLKLSRFICVSETFYESIYTTSPCLMIEVKKDIKIDKYDLDKIAVKYKSNSNKEFDFDTFFKENANYVHKDSKVILELSGGLDSRFVLEILKNANIDTKTLTYGSLNSDELNIAKIVASKNEVEHYETNLYSEDFIDNAEYYIKQVGGMDLFVQSNVYKVFSSINNLDKSYILDTGLYLDFLIGDIYTDDNSFQEDNQVIGNDSFLDSENKKDTKFILENRFYSSLAIRLSAHREYFDDRYSMLSYKCFFYLSSLPISERKNYFLYKNMSKVVIKNSFNVPLHNTMYGLDLDISLWNSAKEIQSKKELLSLENFRLNKKAVYHNRYYSDFDMWLRDKSKWREKAVSLLLSPDTLITEFIDEQSIKETLKCHMSAEKSLHTKIIKWMSIEIFLRQNRSSNE